MRNVDFHTSLNSAIQGFLHALKTQRNMRIHILMACVVMLVGVYMDLGKIDFLFVCAAISLVLICEMFNTAIESAVDLITDEVHPLARIIKDVSAGAVFIATLNALIIGYAVFSRKIGFRFEENISQLKDTPWHYTFLSLILVISAVVIVKALFKSGTPLKGGMPSGHAAVAFGVWMIISIITTDGMISVLVFLLAVLIARQRVTSKIHTGFETFAGALLGMIIPLLVYQVLK